MAGCADPFGWAHRLSPGGADAVLEAVVAARAPQGSRRLRAVPEVPGAWQQHANVVTAIGVRARYALGRDLPTMGTATMGLEFHHSLEGT